VGKSQRTRMSLSEECKKYVSGVKKLGKEPKAKKLSGYNLFSMDKREKLEGSAPEKMKELGAMWKKLSEEKKESWKAKAEKINKKAAREFEEEGDKMDDQLKELKNIIEEIIANFKKNLKGKKVVNSDDESSDNEILAKKVKKLTKAKVKADDNDSSDDSS
jgi:hypothetical protein